MSVLVVGISHNTAPVSLLERVTPDSDGVGKLIEDATGCEHVAESAVISTCNRVEIYAEVDRFHGSVEELSKLLIARAGVSTEEMLNHLYIHYDDGAVSHLFQVAAGLDSMAVGEGQILGQTREALRVGQEVGSVGTALNTLFQQALRVGKRSRAETDIDRVAPTLVSAALDKAAIGDADLSESRVVVVGAGAMAGLATATVARMGAGDLAVVNRTPARAARLAAEYGARPAPLADLSREIARADLVIACAGARGVLVTEEMVAEASRARAAEGRGGLTFLDLALPHDVAPEVGELPGVRLIGLAELAADLHAGESGQEIKEVRRIVGEEVTAFLSARKQASVTPTVVALRSMATEVVDAELDRLLARVPELDDRSREEVRQTVRRVADKLLHEPTVRVKELADTDGTVSYATALAELFALAPEAVDAVTSPVVPEETQTRGGRTP